MDKFKLFLFPKNQDVCSCSMIEIKRQHWAGRFTIRNPASYRIWNSSWDFYIVQRFFLFSDRRQWRLPFSNVVVSHVYFWCKYAERTTYWGPLYSLSQTEQTQLSKEPIYLNANVFTHFHSDVLTFVFHYCVPPFGSDSQGKDFQKNATIVSCFMDPLHVFAVVWHMKYFRTKKPSEN